MYSERGPVERGVWIGQCRVEAMTAEGSGLQLDGLRLSLDLRLPATSRNGAARAVPSRRARWLLAGLGSLALLAVGWWWHAGSPRSGALAPPPRAPASDRAAALPPTLPPPTPAPLAAPPAAQSELAGAAGANEEPPPGAALAGERRSPAPPIVSIRPTASREAAGAGVGAPQAAERRTVREARGASGTLPARTPARTADADLLELFDDTK